MPGKKWCEYCRINLSYNKKDIQEHEETRNHLQNKRKSIKFERIKIINSQKQQRQISKQNAMLSTANIPKAKKGSDLQKQVAQYRESTINAGKAAIHQLIAEKTKGLYGAPIQFPDKEDLVLAENYQHQSDQQALSGQDGDSEQFQMWRIDICEETGEACFLNNVTKAKLYEPPKGYILSEKQAEQWKYLQEICQDKVALAGDNVVNITEWEEVADQDDYFKVNAIQEQNQSQEVKPVSQSLKRQFHHSVAEQHLEKGRAAKNVELKKTWMDNLQEKVNKNEVGTNEVFETVLYHKLKQCKSVKEKNDTLKRLIHNDIQIRQTLEQANEDNCVKLEQKSTIVGFKPKKKVKTIQLSDDKDIF